MLVDYSRVFGSGRTDLRAYEILGPRALEAGSVVAYPESVDLQRFRKVTASLAVGLLLPWHAPVSALAAAMGKAPLAKGVTQAAGFSAPKIPTLPATGDQPLNPGGVRPTIALPGSNAPLITPLLLPPSSVPIGPAVGTTVFAPAATGPEHGVQGTGGSAAPTATQALAVGSLSALRQTAAHAAHVGQEQGALDSLYEGLTLTLPSGAPLEVHAARTRKSRTEGMMFRDSVPSQGMLIPETEEDGPFAIWRKNTLIPTDIVVLDSEGTVRKVLPDVPPSPPDTPWRKVGMREAHGRYTLLLPAGTILQQGIAEGQRIAGVRPVPLKLEARELALRILDEGQEGAESVWSYFKENPERFAEFDTMVGLVQSAIRKTGVYREPEKAQKYRQAKRALYSTVLLDEEAGVYGYQYQGILSWYDWSLWLRTIPWKKKAAAYFNAMLYPVKFVHETGHYLAARLVGLKVEKFRVNPGPGGFISVAALPPTGWRSFFILLAGPGLQFVAGAVLAFQVWAAFWAPGGMASLAAGQAVLLAGVWASWDWMSSAIPSGAFDFADAAGAAGWKRLASELSWRWERGDYKTFPFKHGFYRLFFDVLVREPLGAPISIKASLAEGVSQAASQSAPRADPSPFVQPGTLFEQLARTLLGVEFIELASGKKIPLHKGFDGRYYVYIFPFIRTAVTFLGAEPTITVYRGIRNEFNPIEEGRFGTHIFTTLSPRIAISYLTRTISFTTPKHLTLLKMQLPLRQAKIAKRPKLSLREYANEDKYLPALENRSYMWFRWRAWDRLRERELVWDLNELGGDMSDSKYDVQLIGSPVKRNPQTGEWTSYAHWYAAADNIKAAFKTGIWSALLLDRGISVRPGVERGH